MEWYGDYYDQGGAGENNYVGSHLMNSEAFEDATALGAAWKEFSEVGRGGSAYLIAGAGVRDAQHGEKHLFLRVSHSIFLHNLT